MSCVLCVSVTVTGGGGHRGDGCVLAATLCMFTLRKGDLFVLSWARVRRMRRGSIFSELLMCCGGVRCIFLLSRDGAYLFLSVVVVTVGFCVNGCKSIISNLKYLYIKIIVYTNFSITKTNFRRSESK